MILVAGGTGRLGSLVVNGLEALDVPTRTLSHHSDGDLRGITETSLEGVSVVVSAVTGFPTQRPRDVDRDGNIALIDAAERAGADVVLVSVLGASPDSPMELFRMKHAAEEHLRRSRCSWTIVRPDAFKEMWVEILEQTAGRQQRPLVFGRGDNPFAWVSVETVAAEVVAVATNASMRGLVVDVRGPQRLTLDQLARRVMSDHGWQGAPRHVPRAVLHPMSLAPGAPGRRAHAALAMDIVSTQ
ncbi:NAD(P)H-binding protein [Cellulomonas sp. McL0617]|uniref:NAD(P)H-binding protein n=1 Tax=Cellulomonas sp. McL0617 TaxID=3415675 RepID=UPI003CEC79B9